jgi:hypothetical protein
MMLERHDKSPIALRLSCSARQQKFGRSVQQSRGLWLRYDAAILLALVAKRSILIITGLERMRNQFVPLLHDVTISQCEDQFLRGDPLSFIERM